MTHAEVMSLVTWKLIALAGLAVGVVVYETLRRIRVKREARRELVRRLHAK